MSDMSLAIEAAERVFKDQADPQSIILAGDDGWKSRLWDAMEHVGLPTAWLPEALGGIELSLAEGFGLIRSAGRFALAAPFVQTLISGWVAGRAGFELPPGPTCIVLCEKSRMSVSVDKSNRLTGAIHQVPFARDAKNLLLVMEEAQGTTIGLIHFSDCTITPGYSLAFDANDTVAFSQVTPSVLQSAPELDFDAVQFLCATANAVCVSGALEVVLDLSVNYAQERIAFERPIAKFQAVQQSLARLGGEVAASLAVSESAAQALSLPDITHDSLLLEVASAKIRCSQAAEQACALAHQVHGAIGFTAEHILHRYTLRALSWRDEFGSATAWSRRLGQFVSARKGTELWSFLTAA